MDSDLMWVWDEDAEMTFDEKIVRHIYANDTIDFETLMDRPLRGLPLIDEHMYRRMGLCPLATTEITSPGGCVVAQFAQTVTTEKKVGERTTVGGKRIDNRKVVQVPRYTHTLRSSPNSTRSLPSSTQATQFPRKTTRMALQSLLALLHTNLKAGWR